MSISLTGRTRRWVTGLLDDINNERVYETPDYQSYAQRGDKDVLVTARLDWLYAQDPALVALGPWVKQVDGQSRRLWELTGDGRLALAQSMVAAGGAR